MELIAALSTYGLFLAFRFVKAYLAASAQVTAERSASQRNPVAYTGPRYSAHGRVIAESFFDHSAMRRI